MIYLKKAGRYLSITRCAFIIANKKGATMITALLIMIILTLLGTVAITSVNTDMKISHNFQCDQEAFYTAEAGINRGKVLLDAGASNSWDDELTASLSTANANDYWADSTSLTNTSSYTITVSDQDGTNTVDEDGRVLLLSSATGCKNSSKQIEMWVKNISSNISQKHYGENNRGNALTETGTVANNNLASY